MKCNCRDNRKKGYSNTNKRAYTIFILSPMSGVFVNSIVFRFSNFQKRKLQCNMHYCQCVLLYKLWQSISLSDSLSLPPISNTLHPPHVICCTVSPLCFWFSHWFFSPSLTFIYLFGTLSSGIHRSHLRCFSFR